MTDIRKAILLSCLLWYNSSRCRYYCHGKSISLPALITVHKWSCGKVMFSQACVKNSFQGVARPRPGGDLLEGYPGPGGVQVQAQGGCPGPGGCVSQYALRQTTPPPPPADGYCCGQYASYWNAFLFLSMYSYLWSGMNRIKPLGEIVHVKSKIKGMDFGDLEFIS